jgi:hypothetical protein
VEEEWEETARRRPYLHLDARVVMPNHFHGILFIDPPRLGGRSRPLGSIIGHFKGACTGRIWAEGRGDFAWQARFFDQIIRDEETLIRYRTSPRILSAGRRTSTTPERHDSSVFPPPTTPGAICAIDFSMVRKGVIVPNCSDGNPPM